MKLLSKEIYHFDDDEYTIRLRNMNPDALYKRACLKVRAVVSSGAGVVVTSILVILTHGAMSSEVSPRLEGPAVRQLFSMAHSPLMLVAMSPERPPCHRLGSRLSRHITQEDTTRPFSITTL